MEPDGDDPLDAGGSPLPVNAFGDSPEPDYYTVSLTLQIEASSFQEAAEEFRYLISEDQPRSVLVEHIMSLEQRYVEV